jgi:hypothetical protein
MEEQIASVKPDSGVDLGQWRKDLFIFELFIEYINCIIIQITYKLVYLVSEKNVNGR